jgi:proteasome accessory factor B
MSSAKTERLVNLTMALLGTKRFMTKAEIFRRVAGYSGNPETKERMFERDKDDLRSLGIEIEVSTHDAYFEDEVGYRIRPEAFQIHENFDAEELGLISLSLNLFGSEDFASAAQALNLRSLRHLFPKMGSLRYSKR